MGVSLIGIEDPDDIMVNFAKCCNPIRGEGIAHDEAAAGPQSSIGLAQHLPFEGVGEVVQQITHQHAVAERILRAQHIADREGDSRVVDGGRRRRANLTRVIVHPNYRSSRRPQC